MGILDEAIRDHLDLKRKGGAQETDLRRLEDEAFGPPSRPGGPAPEVEAAVAEKGAATMEPPAPTEPREEAEPFAEGGPEDELASGGFHDFAAEEGLVSSSRGALAPPSPVEQEFSVDQAEVDVGEPEIADESPQPEPPPSPDPQPTPEPEPEPSEPSPPTPAAGEPTAEDTQPHDMQTELGAPEAQPQPTPADEIEIAEEDLELDLDEELDPSSALPESEPERREGPTDSGEGVEVIEDQDDSEPQDSGEDVLEETPEFLRETPEHDRLWFEQKPPKDFDFDED